MVEIEELALTIALEEAAWGDFRYLCATLFGGATAITILVFVVTHYILKK